MRSAVAVVLATLAGGPPAAWSRPAGRNPDTLRYPYSPGAVYRLRLVPGAPFVIELPAGESARNLWLDNRWWAAETTPGSTRVVLRAIGSSDVIGKRGLVHIETEPSDYRISIKVEACGENEEVPAALQIYVEGNDPARQQTKRVLDSELVYARKHAEEKARAEFEAWRRNALANLRTDFEWGGDFRIAKVVDDRVQTFITVPDASDKAVIQYVDRAGKKEIANYELQNGTYVVQNRVLKPGEKFRLILGKEQAWVALK